jgi:ribosome-associated toxin RatA of RatAB toxin-antitoxin module
VEQTVAIEALVPGVDPDTAFARVLDFERYAEHTAGVRHVDVRDEGDDGVRSTWEVDFRGGVLMWTERDEVDLALRRIDFTQTEGDFATFDGHWTVDARGRGSVVRFACRFDLGMPTLASMVDPVASRALRESMHEILRGLFGPLASISDRG